MYGGLSLFMLDLYFHAKIFCSWFGGGVRCIEVSVVYRCPLIEVPIYDYFNLIFPRIQV